MAAAPDAAASGGPPRLRLVEQFVQIGFPRDGASLVRLRVPPRWTAEEMRIRVLNADPGPDSGATAWSNLPTSPEPDGAPSQATLRGHLRAESSATTSAGPGMTEGPVTEAVVTPAAAAPLLITPDAAEPPLVAGDDAAGTIRARRPSSGLAPVEVAACVPLPPSPAPSVLPGPPTTVQDPPPAEVAPAATEPSVAGTITGPEPAKPQPDDAAAPPPPRTAEPTATQAAAEPPAAQDAAPTSPSAPAPSSPSLPEPSARAVNKKTPHPVEYSYLASIVDSYPALSTEQLQNDYLQHLPLFAFPDHMRIVESPGAPPPTTNHSFVITKEDGTKLHCVALTFWEKPTGQLALALKYHCRAWYVKNINESDLEYLHHVRKQIQEQRSLLAHGGLDPDEQHIVEDKLRLFTDLMAPFTTNACVDVDALYVPRALCLLSPWPVYDLMEDYLKCVFWGISNNNGSALSLDACLINLIHEVPIPPPGRKEIAIRAHSHDLYFARPAVNEITAMKNISFYPLFRALTVEQVVYLVECMLNEKRLLFVSKHLGMLNSTIQALILFMFPFGWFHVVIPVLPVNLLSYIEAPVPYLIGIHAAHLSCLETPLDDMVVVHLDEGTVTSTLKAAPVPLPPRRRGKLLARLRSSCQLYAAGPPLQVAESFPLGKLCCRTTVPTAAVPPHQRGQFSADPDLVSPISPGGHHHGAGGGGTPGNASPASIQSTPSLFGRNGSTFSLGDRSGAPPSPSVHTFASTTTTANNNNSPSSASSRLAMLLRRTSQPQALSPAAVAPRSASSIKSPSLADMTATTSAASSVMGQPLRTASGSPLTGIPSPGGGAASSKKIIEGHVLSEVPATGAPTAGLRRGSSPLSPGHAAGACDQCGSSGSDAADARPVWRCEGCGMCVHAGECSARVLVWCPAALDEARIRRAWLKCWVSLMRGYRGYLIGGAAHDEAKAKQRWLADGCDADARWFMTAFAETQAFAQFVQDRSASPSDASSSSDADAEIIFFDEAIKAKRGKLASFTRPSSDAAAFFRDTAFAVATVHRCVLPVAGDRAIVHTTFPYTDPAAANHLLPPRPLDPLITPQEELMLSLYTAKMIRQAAAKRATAATATTAATGAGGSSSALVSAAGGRWNPNEWFKRTSVSLALKPGGPATPTSSLPSLLVSPQSRSASLVPGTAAAAASSIDAHLSAAWETLKDPGFSSPLRSRAEYAARHAALARIADTLHGLVAATADERDVDDVVRIAAHVDRRLAALEAEFRSVFVDAAVLDDVAKRPPPQLSLHDLPSLELGFGEGEGMLEAVVGGSGGGAATGPWASRTSSSSAVTVSGKAAARVPVGTQLV
ncbi:hypothetical protein H9P43_000875 [Blastocladiella emersonii ATCC 22665]|nr:hypothetical protein H9P43_000875 [Blastocladiella emersonii ATCC 22665]